MNNVFRCGFLLTSLVLSACGFHLRGMMDMPRWLNPMSVVIEHAHRDMGPYLIESLQSYSIAVKTDPAQAQYWLIIEQDNLQEQISSVSSNTTSRQYELNYQVQFKLTEARGREIIPSTHLTVTRQVTINNNRILGSNQEQTLLLNEMRRDAASQIIYRLSRYQTRPSELLRHAH